MKTLDPTSDVICSRCGKPNAVWDIGTCWDCLDVEANERLAKQVLDGSVERRIADLQRFVDALKLTRNFSTTDRRSFKEYVKRIDVL